MDFRPLFEKIMDYEGNAIFDELKNYEELTDAKKYLLSLDIFNTSLEDHYGLYSLSRILDILTLRFQPDKNADGSTWLGSDISLKEFMEFAKSLGLKADFPKYYHPFNCEIFEAGQEKIILK